MNNNEEFTLLDTLSLASFLLGVLNYEENLTQGDKQEIMQELSKKTDSMLSDVHAHLTLQDVKLNYIIRLLEGENHDSRRGV